jgi:hypothetical protein
MNVARGPSSIPGGPLLTDDEIKAMIKQAFTPFRCVVEILPDRQMRFQVIKQKETDADVYRGWYSY